MAYIEPDSKIYIMSGIPLDPTYEHTIYFDNISNQQSYFGVTVPFPDNYVKYVFEKQMYQRVNRGFLRIRRKAEDLYNCNYLAFQNTAYGDKWFYAFIKTVEYINNEVSQIEYEIDVMQTWHFDYRLEQCFVDREHAASDELFENLVPENLDAGSEIVAHEEPYVIDLNHMRVGVIYTPIKDGGVAVDTPSILNNVYTGLAFRSYDMSDPNFLNNMQQFYETLGDGYEDKIIAMYQYPAVFETYDPELKQYPIAANLPHGSTISAINIDGYVPKNKKLFIYPYNFIQISNNSGQIANYKYENFSDLTNNQTTFALENAAFSSPACILYPVRHRGIIKDYDSGMTLSNFPVCAWVGDAYKSWWAQNKNQVSTSLISSTVTTLVTAIGSAALAAAFPASAPFVAAGTIASAANFAGNAAQTVAKQHDLENTPPQVHGQTQTDVLNASMQRIGFRIAKMTIKRQFAEIIDGYFSQYGYATHKVKVPNRAVREHWTYTKTIGCQIIGALPADAAAMICNIYNHGITFWKAEGIDVQVCNYSLSNEPTGVNKLE